MTNPAPSWAPDPAPFRHALAVDTPAEKADCYQAFVRAETVRRIELAKACETDKGLRRALMEEIYPDDPVAWANDWVWVENPWAQSLGMDLMVPLYLYGRDCMPEAKRDDPDWLSQVEVWEWWQKLEDDAQQMPEGVEALLKKSREMVMSYSAIAYGIHGISFDDKSFLYVSTTQKLVDSLGDSDSLIEKARIILEHLPEWMTEGWNRADEKHSKLGLITHPRTGGRLKGAWGSDAGRAGRAAMAFMDEDAANPHSRLICKAMSKTARVRVRITTSRGPATDFAQEWSKNKKPRAFLPWYCNPFLDSAYGERYEAANGAIARAEELEGDDEGSAVGSVIPLPWLLAAIEWEPEQQEWAKRVIGYDIADDGDDNAVRVYREGPIIREIEADPNEKPRDGHERVKAMQARMGAQLVVYDGGGGFSGTFQSYYQDAKERVEGGDPLAFKIVGCKGARKPPKDLFFDDDGGRESAYERFTNMRTVYIWNLRERCRKTYERINGLRDWGEDECVSLPDLTALREECLMPRIIKRGGKTATTSKKDLPRSTDYLDAVCLAMLAEDAGLPEGFGLTTAKPDPAKVRSELERRKALIAAYKARRPA